MNKLLIAVSAFLLLALGAHASPAPVTSFTYSGMAFATGCGDGLGCYVSNADMDMHLGIGTYKEECWHSPCGEMYSGVFSFASVSGFSIDGHHRASRLWRWAAE